MSEKLPSEESIEHLSAGQSIDLLQAKERVMRDQLAVYQFDQNSEVLPIATEIMDKVGSWSDLFPWDVDQDIPESELMQTFWDAIVGKGSGFKAGNDIINKFHANSHIPKHVDWETPWDDLRVPAKPEEATENLSFIYVVSGSKNIIFYMGEGEEQKVIEQKPGMLLVFPQRDIDRGDTTILRALPHEAPPQDANCVTISWQLTPVTSIN